MHPVMQNKICACLTLEPQSCATGCSEWGGADNCIAVQGLAASRPIAGNDSESGRIANRRVDIHLVPQVGACGQTVAVKWEAGKK